MAKNTREMIEEVLRAGTSKKHGALFGFIIDVGVERMERDSFEWRKVTPAPGEAKQEGGHIIKTRYTLHRLTAADQSDSDSDVVVILACNQVLSVTHFFSLELQGAGLTGELGDR
ncbi:hypothetical protein N657DRAFT_708041 [Parathielavia appendiculata]|uniref:Uncharacterized protein n=1 Tax=Parathielavia appendiculata TaxID=2587402 RepID=A0AAN6Z5Y3_9PEZI|nr:hypothetical protein N657DRAFT_708041 [Parathielavia appendiculata]